jgi:tetratricopeptide (TPR) repeat protein
VSEFIRENVLEAPGKAGARIIEDLSSPAVLSQSEVANDEGRYQLTETLTSLVLQKCESQPLVIFVDDAQWADEYTALLLSYWAYRLRSHAVLLLLTVRTEEAEPPPEWIFSDLGRVSELHLSRISIEAASDIVSAFESSKGIALDKKLRDAVLWQSGGRPFLLLEALSSIIGDDLVSKPTAESVLTESAESVLRRRFRNLSSDATSVLSALAVWGREIGSTALSRIAAVHGEPFVRALDLLHSRGIAYWLDGLVAFPHDLMREAAYRNLTPPMRALYHRRAAEEVHESAGRVGLVAQHYARAGDSYLAASHASQAAVEAMAAHSYTDYEYYCRLSIDHGTVQQKRQAADKLSRFLVRVGRTAEIEALGYLLQGGTAEQALLMDISRFERDLARGDCQVIDLLARAKAIIGMAASLKDLTAAPVVATLIDVAFDAGADDFGLQVIDTLLPEPSHTLASEAQIAVESIVAVWRGVTEDIGAGLRQAEVALSRLPQPSSPTTEALCLASYGTLQLLSGRIALARSKFEGALKLSVAAGDHRRQLSILNNNGIALLEAGDIAGARQSFERVLTAPNIHSRIRGYGNLAILHYEVDDLTNAALAAEAVLSMNAAYRSPALDILGHSILGLISLRDDKISRANSHACQVRRLIDLDGRRSGDATYSTLLLTRLLLHDGRKEDALLMLDQMIEQTQSRDILCAMRLKCEKASIAGATEPDKGFAIAREVISESSARGASLIERYASDIIRRFVHY